MMDILACLVGAGATGKEVYTAIKRSQFHSSRTSAIFSCGRISPMFKEIFSGKFFASGFIKSEERIKICQKAGFDGVMTSTKKLWSYIK